MLTLYEIHGGGNCKHWEGVAGGAQWVEVLATKSGLSLRKI